MNLTKKTAALLLALIACACLMTGCSEEKVHEGFFMADAPGADFIIYLPDGWESSYASAALSANPENDHSASLTMMAAAYSYDEDVANDAEAGTHPIDLYWCTYKKVLEQTFSDIEYTVAGDETTLGGLPAKRYEYKATIAGDAYCFEQVITIKGTFISGAEVYIFTYAAKEASFAKYYDTVGECVSFIELK